MSLVDTLPAVNAALNGTATVLLTAGYLCIRSRRERAHGACMIAAFTVSAIFLITYVTHKYLMRGMHTPFEGEGLWRWIYYPMLISHIILAMAVVPLVLTTLALIFQGKRERHKAWARWTFPVWYYVSVTGVLVYFFLYQWF